MLNAILSRSSGRLFTEIRDKRGLAYTAYSSVSQFVDGGIFMVYAGTQPATANAVLDLLKAELQRIREQPIDGVELQNAIEGEVGAGRWRWRRARTRRCTWPEIRVFGVPPREIQAAETRAVTAGDVQRVAQTLPRSVRFSVVIASPSSPGDDDRDDEDAP